MRDADSHAGSKPEYHPCQAHAQGEWIVFRCPQCPDYERRINWRTGEMEASNVKAHIHHTGNFVPEELGALSGYLH